jgi:hypothetical protein
VNALLVQRQQHSFHYSVLYTSLAEDAAILVTYQCREVKVSRHEERKETRKIKNLGLEQ